MNIKQIILPLFIIISFSLFSQESNENDSFEENEFKKIRIAFSLGHGYIPNANPEGKNFLIIPTLGLDIQYWFNKKWGIALKNDVEISNYVVEDKTDNSKLVERENPFIISMPLLISPWDNELTFMIGPGVEIEKNENFSILRIGVGYEFEFGNEWDFSPEFVYDLKDESINSFTFAFGVGKRF